MSKNVPASGTNVRFAPLVVRLFVVQPFDQSCWIGVGPLGAAFANGVMVARLRAINAARIKYVIGVLHLFSPARCPALALNMDALYLLNPSE
jgi:hypothetical protein